MNGENVRKWCRLLEEGGTNVHDDKRSGHLSLVLI